MEYALKDWGELPSNIDFGNPEVNYFRTYQRVTVEGGLPLPKHQITLLLVGAKWPEEGWVEEIVSSLDAYHDGSFKQFFIMWIDGNGIKCHNCGHPYKGSGVHVCRRTE